MARKARTEDPRLARRRRHQTRRPGLVGTRSHQTNNLPSSRAPEGVEKARLPILPTTVNFLPTTVNFLPTTVNFNAHYTNYSQFLTNYNANYNANLYWFHSVLATSITISQSFHASYSVLQHIMTRLLLHHSRIYTFYSRSFHILIQTPVRIVWSPCNWARQTLKQADSRCWTLLQSISCLYYYQTTSLWNKSI